MVWCPHFNNLCFYSIAYFSAGHICRKKLVFTPTFIILIWHVFLPSLVASHFWHLLPLIGYKSFRQKFILTGVTWLTTTHFDMSYPVSWNLFWNVPFTRLVYVLFIVLLKKTYVILFCRKFHFRTKILRWLFYYSDVEYGRPKVCRC